MADSYPPTRQREALMALLGPLDATPSALKRDGCGDPRIDGRWGCVYSTPNGYQIVVLSEKAETGSFDRWTSQGWTWAKKALSFAEIVNDGDTEGAFLLDRLPTPDEAEVIRRYCGIRQRTHYSEETLARLRAQLAENREALGAKTASDDEAAIPVAADP